MTRTPPACVICGGRLAALLHEDSRWRVIQCECCGLGMLDPRPDAEEMALLYDRAYFDGHYAGELTAGSEALVRRLRQEDHRLRFFKRFKKKGRLLDIGCGRGYFLLAGSEKGYAVEGFDVSNAAAGHIREAFGIPVHVGDIRFFDLPQKSFDIITFWHSLEHALDPAVYVQAANRWLADDGILVIDVPNVEGYDARHYGRNWAHWDLPFHYVHFTPASLRRLLERHGFEVVRQKTYLSDYVKEKLQKRGWPSTVARIVAKCYTGGSLAVIARKRKI